MTFTKVICIESQEMNMIFYFISFQQYGNDSKMIWKFRCDRGSVDKLKGDNSDLSQEMNDILFQQYGNDSKNDCINDWKHF